MTGASRPWRCGVVVAAVAVAVGVALVVGLSPRDAASLRPVVVAAIALGLAATLVAGRGRQRATSRAWSRATARAVLDGRRRPTATAAGAAVWAGLLVAVAVWDVLSFAAQRHDLPTLSHYVGYLTTGGIGRAALAIGWVGWGAWIALGFRRPSP